MAGGLLFNLFLSIKGFVVIMLAHAFISSALFFIVNIKYERTATRQILVSRHYSNFSFLTGIFLFIFLAANFAAPPFVSLLGELRIFLGAVVKRPVG
jgi:NADH-quinone oxidoreductase subunit M